MRIVIGTRVERVDAAAVAAWAANYREVVIDLGTGDGRFVRDVARRGPEVGAIGVDLCEANLRGISRGAPGNALFVVADALAPPAELSRLASHLTINFPWGSLLRGLLAGDDGLLTGLRSLARAGAALDVRLNAGALGEAGWTLETGADRVAAALVRAGFAIVAARELPVAALREVPTTWAKRLAFGRDPRAVQLKVVHAGRAADGSVLDGVRLG